MTTVDLLVVCEGNVARSPATARILADQLQGSPVTVASAGTRALVGEGIWMPVAARLESVGIDSTGHYAREIDRSQVRAADLVLAATREQASAVLALDGAAMRKTFTLVGFARLVESLKGERTIAEAVAARGVRVPLHLAEDDLDDPFRRSDEVVESVFARVLSTCSRISPWLHDVAAGAPHPGHQGR